MEMFWWRYGDYVNDCINHNQGLRYDHDIILFGSRRLRCSSTRFVTRFTLFLSYQLHIDTERTGLTRDFVTVGWYWIDCCPEMVGIDPYSCIVLVDGVFPSGSLIESIQWGGEGGRPRGGGGGERAAVQRISTRVDFHLGQMDAVVERTPPPLLFGCYRDVLVPRRRSALLPAGAVKRRRQWAEQRRSNRSFIMASYIDDRAMVQRPKAPRWRRCRRLMSPTPWPHLLQIFDFSFHERHTSIQFQMNSMMVSVLFFWPANFEVELFDCK